MPIRPRLAEREAVRWVGIDFEIAADGTIWRLRLYNQPCARHRTECHGPDGYLKVTTKAGMVYAHRLVYQFFYGDIPEGKFLNHKNGNKADNRPENLEVVTHVENHRHRFEVLGHQSRVLRGAASPSAKLTEENVAEIRRRYADGATQGSLAAEFRVSQCTISFVVSGRTWRKDGYTPPPKGLTIRGERQRKLSDDDVTELRRLASEGMEYKSLAARFGITADYASAVARGLAPRTRIA